MPRLVATRRQFRLPIELNDRLNEVSRKSKVPATVIIADALRSWLNRKGEDELELRFGASQNRILRQLGRLDRKDNIILETLALFILYMLTINAPIPEGDDTARAIGRDRFEAFVERVGRKIRTGRTTFLHDFDEDSDGSEKK
ncbi:MAG TPA: CopG family transcriptional regulator [Sphingomicrobium sp.]|nr:CopG family transcriptional regulator [Sphingomicrobium sp.]